MTTPKISQQYWAFQVMDILNNLTIIKEEVDGVDFYRFQIDKKKFLEDKKE